MDPLPNLSFSHWCNFSISLFPVVGKSQQKQNDVVDPWLMAHGEALNLGFDLPLLKRSLADVGGVKDTVSPD